jgi:excisionase family DNA binding protein
MTDQWVSIPEAAKQAQVTTRTIGRWIKAGKIRIVAVRINGRVYRRARLVDVMQAERDTRIRAGRLH